MGLSTINATSSALSPLGVIVSAAAAPDVAAFTSVSSSSLNANWLTNGNPADTEFRVELASAPDLAPPTFSSGWVRASTFAFGGLAAQATYYARVKARNRAGIETAYIELGSARTSAFTILPPLGAPGNAFTLVGATFGPFAGDNTRVRFGIGGSTAAITSWTSARVNGVVPNISSGTYAVLIERQNGATLTMQTGDTFTVLPAVPSSGTVLTLSPADGDEITTSAPTIEADYAATAGVDTTSVRLTLDGAVVAATVGASSATFVPMAALSEGTHTVTASVADRNANVASSTAVFLIDTIAPVTMLAVDGLTASATTLTVISTDALSLAATDAGSGVSDTFYLVDVDPNSCDFSGFTSTAPAGTCGNPYYGGPFSLAVGTHTLAFYSDDAAGNSEDYTHVALTVRSPVYAATSADGVATLLSSSSSETVTAVAASNAAVAAAAAQRLTSATSSYDLVPDGVSFNPLAALQFRFNPNALSTATFAIYTFNGVYWDSAAITSQQLTNLSSSTVLLSGTVTRASLYAVFSAPLDLLPPRTALVIGAPVFVATQTFVSSATPFGFSAVDDKFAVGDGLGVGVAKTFYAVDAGSFTAYSGTFTLVAQGTHTITFYSVDVVGNTEVARSSTVAVDIVAPVTQLAYAGGRQFAVPGVVYASSDTGFAFNVIDPVSSGVASGVAFTRYRDGAASFQVYVSSFALAEGVHPLGFQSQDNVGNLELLEGTTVFVDATPPVTAVAVGSPAFTASDGTLYIGTTTPVSFMAADPALSSSTVAGSGVSHIEVAVDTTAFTAYVSTLTFAEGRHAVLYRAVDNVGNVEAARTLLVQADATPPSVQLQVLNSSFTDAAGNLDVSTASALALLSVDPVVSSVASGVRLTQYQIGGGSFTVYSGTFTLAAPDGPRQLAFQTTDNVGNASLLKSATVYLDATAPVTALTVGVPQFASSGTVYVSTLTPFALASQDPLVNGVASGVRGVFVATSSGAFTAYAGTFTLTAPDGARTVAWYAADNVGNIEAVKSTTTALDATPPVTALSLSGGRQFQGLAGFYASSDTRLVLGSTDPAVNGVASGVAFTRWQDSGGAFQLYASSLALVEGSHALGYQSQDNVQNLEVLRSTTILIDETPPVSAVSIGSPTYTAADGTIYVATTTPVAFTAADPALASSTVAGSGVARIEISLDSAPFVAYSSALFLAEGRHAILYRSVDNVGNIEAARTLLVQADATPPQTALAVSSPSFGGFVSSTTIFTLSAVDPSSNSVASGVASTRYRINGGSFGAYSSALRLSGADGAYTLDYQSVDNVGNTEVLRSTTVLLDQTPPVTTAHVGASSYTAAGGTLYVTPATPVTFTAVDPSSAAAASGVAQIQVAVDTGSFTLYTATLTFAEGVHTVLFRAVDNVGNVETAHALTLDSDATAPATALAPSATFYASNGRNYAPASFFYALAANDPVSNNVASGLAFTRYALDGGAFQAYVSTFGLTEGVRLVAFQSQDNVGNLELPKSATVYVDATPPVTALNLGAPQFAAGGTLFVSTATPFAFASQDPLVNGVASGVRGVIVATSSGVFAAYTSTFTLLAPEGMRVIAWQAADNVGNTEAVKFSTVTLDATPPLTSLLVVSGRQYAGPDASTFYASADTRFVLVSTDPATNGAASGVAFTRWQDSGGAFQLYASSLALAEGAHALGYQSQDNVQNLEVLRSTTVLIDATPPATTVVIGSPTFTAADGTIYIATTTPIGFSAADPALPGGRPGSGLARIEVSVDSAPFAPYAAALTFAEGRHVVLYRAIDNVGNVEPARTLALSADATRPISSLAIGSPQFSLSSATVLVSSLTPIGIAAVDPVSNGVASGVRQTFYAVDGGTFSVFAASFTLAAPDGAHLVSFYSQDNVLNAESVKTGAVVLDATPPEAALLSPASCDGGICRVLKGRFPVLGTARDLHFAGYVLGFAPGQNATTGYALINSGTAAVSSGTLGVWDASALSGWQTLRLTATDLVANVTVVAVNVFVGDPGELMVLGNHDVFDMPQGVAADAHGGIYVADTNANRVAVFTATGAFVTAYGQVHGDHDDVSRVSTATVRFNKPKGVAVDAGGNIYVADTNDDRVLELSATGQILLTIGRREKADKDRDAAPFFRPGKGPGEFNKPSGVALDASGNIYVADTNNNRVQVLSSTGAFRLAFSLPPLPAQHADEREDRDADQPALGRPFGIAVDASGKIYVADPAGGRALVYGATGQLLLTLPIAGAAKDGRAVPGRPEGVAVSTDGYCLLISDHKLDRVLKFDVLGDQTLAFGAPGKLDDDKPAAGIVFHRPAGLALAPDGTLLVADRNNDRVERFGLPTGKPALVVPPSAGDDKAQVAKDVLDSDSGGAVARSDKAGVTIPPGALADDLKITVSTMSPASAAQADAMGRVAGGKGLAPASAPVEYGPEGTQFAAPVTLTVPYDPNLVAAEGMSEDSLKVRYWNKDKGDWETLDSTVDKGARTVTAKTPHFSLYQVLGSTGTGTVAPLATADPTFTFHDAYAFPNPVRGTRVVTIRMQTGLADSVEVHAYDLSGRRVYSSSNFTLNPALDDGNGKGTQYTYDNVWDISGIGSGVYTYVITAKKAGMSDIHKTGRVGVVK
ncbi:MAG: OmpL47-type beta-barrel domain-containing protein [Elusimicrobiota bacterium]